MSSSPLTGILVLALLVAAPLLLRRVRAASPDGVRVLARTALHKSAVVAVLAVGDRRLLVGAGDRGVQLLADLDVEAAAHPDAAPGDHTHHTEPAGGVWSPDPLATSSTTETLDRTDAVVVATSTTSDMAAALAALHADADATLTAGPRTGLVDRLRAMTVRTTPTAGRPDGVGVGRLTRDPLAGR